jgi:flagellar hook capping protein FlgD
MNTRAYIVCIALIASPLAGMLIPGTASSQPGMVLSYQKISDTQGSFTAVLHDGDELGGATAGLGDLDGGGPSVRAMAVGAAFDDDAGTDAGAVYIMFLASNGTVLSYQKINNASLPGQLGAGDEFGSSLAFLGDLDGPGPSVAALAVGVTGDDDGGSNRGAVYILFLSSSGTVLSYQKISDTQGNFTAPMLDVDELGGAVAYLGDLDGGGPSVAALAVGATGDNDGGADQGAVYIMFLASNGTVLSYQKISETAGGFPAVLEAFDDFGGSLAALGDLDEAGPSVAALAVGAAQDETPPALPDANRGAVYILFLASNGTVLSYQKLTNTDFPADGDQFGDAVANMGDLDGAGPGVRSLAVGVTGDDDGGTIGADSDRGAVYVLSLSATATVLSFQKISDFYGGFTAPLHNLDNVGSSLGSLGDLDGAGPSVAAMAVGATGDDDGNPIGGNRGAVYIMFLDGNSVAGVSGPPAAAPRAVLGRARPNPFHPSTTIPFRLAQSALVQIDVLDIGGRQVRQLLRQQSGPGEHSVVWDGRDDSGNALAPGTYFYRMSVDGRVLATAEKALLLR